MGAENSEVTSTTTSVLLESATFNPLAVRRAAQRVGLRTEASARFEKGLDVNNAARAIDRACELIETIGAGRVCPGLIDAWPVKPEPATIPFSRDGINRILGTDLSEDYLLTCLKRWRSPSTRRTRTNGLSPGWRPTCSARLTLPKKGPGSTAIQHPAQPLSASRRPWGPERDQRIRENQGLMLAAGFYEACTYAFEARADESSSCRRPCPCAVRSDHQSAREDYAACAPACCRPSDRRLNHWNRSSRPHASFEMASSTWLKPGRYDLPDEERRLSAFCTMKANNGAAVSRFSALRASSRSCGPIWRPGGSLQRARGRTAGCIPIGAPASSPARRNLASLAKSTRTSPRPSSRRRAWSCST